MTIRPGGAVKLQWTKAPSGTFTATLEPFVARLEPKPDGRCAWDVTEMGKRSPLATGVAASVGQAKTKVEQFIARSGRV